MLRLLALGILVLPALLVGGAIAAPAPEPSSVGRSAPPLEGRVVVLDPGHQLGNRNFPVRVNRPVPDGRGGHKACNTTGTATNGGYPEATFVWRTSVLLRDRLERLGATVLLTRRTNSDRDWGPCVDVRGRAGNREHADLKLSLHGDGSLAPDARGFHVIVAPDRDPAGGRLSRIIRTALRAQGVPVANYIAGGDGLDQRTDLATLNHSRIPTAMVELGNMRDPRDARRMTTERGRTAYAAALTDAVRRFLG